MIKSRKKNTIYIDLKENANYKTDKYQNWEYVGDGKNIGSKYNVKNDLMDTSRWFVDKKRIFMDLNDA